MKPFALRNRPGGRATRRTQTRSDDDLLPGDKRPQPSSQSPGTPSAAYPLAMGAHTQQRSARRVRGNPKGIHTMALIK